MWAKAKPEPKPGGSARKSEQDKECEAIFDEVCEDIPDRKRTRKDEKTASGAKKPKVEKKRKEKVKQSVQLGRILDELKDSVKLELMMDQQCTPPRSVRLLAMGYVASSMGRRYGCVDTGD
eukprot:gene31004-30065_t